MNYFTVFTDVLLKPSEFFKKMPREDNLLHSLIFSVMFLLLTVLTGHFFNSIYLNKYFEVPGPVLITEFLQIFLFYIFVSIGFILSFKLLGGKENYRDTFKIIAYSYAALPFQFIPFFLMGPIASIYWVHICTRGGQFVHNIGYWKSCLIVLIGSFILPLLLLCIIIYIVSAL
ncbi:hypothetical protein EO95_03150 [Methanosarcina sp. 1.H.T.1A.1]|uniref:YIP1 family protein n=1 Tax=unclassified Methanosarcina TaxID=2644672 RepID=UPI000622279F|nr:hypothetical protein EO93_15100 [Methanosarcina sp. 1.H.A.2.2]KKH98214.1 hypothetical protein EO95_03150 [Methanosarcina sp. 1.H.T.1A.1]